MPPEPDPSGSLPLLPAYGRGCVADLVPALLGPGGTRALPDWFPAPAIDAKRVVLLVLDGIGWEQLSARPNVAPTLSSMIGRSITTVAPTTTATALTSIATGLTPGEHGIVGYRIAIHGEVLNVLRWGTSAGDARRRIPPRETQRVPGFLGAAVPAVTKAEFAGSGFTDAHLSGARLAGWRMPSTLVSRIAAEIRAGAPFVYGYYDGVDKVAHEFGFGEEYDAELRAADRLVADLLDLLPPDVVLLVTADHGQVDCGKATIPVASEVLRFVQLQSGEGRFRWLHARAGASADLLAAAQSHHGSQAWVVPLSQTLDEAWFGQRVTPEARGRLGDVALVAKGTASFDDPDDSGLFALIGRHGSLTPAEVLVPLLASRGRA